MSNEATQHARVAKQHGVAMIWDDANSCARTVKPDEVKTIFHRDVEDQFNVHAHDDNLGIYKKFDPGRDLKTNPAKVLHQARLLRDHAEIDLEADGYGGFFSGDIGAENIDKLWEAREIAPSVQKKRWGATVADIAPDLYFNAELVKSMEIVVTETRIGLTARDVFPFLDLNTWLKQARYHRQQDFDLGYSTPVNINDFHGVPTSTIEDERVEVYRRMYHHTAGMHWTWGEIEVQAEIEANGGPALNLVTRKLEAARNQLLRTENAITYFGHPGYGSDPQDGIPGILTFPGLPEEVAPVTFGAGTPEDDRKLITSIITDQMERTIGAERYDTILVPLKLWTYLNDTMYTDQGAGADSQKLLSAVVMDSLRVWGITKMIWVPEMGYSEKRKDRIKTHITSDAVAEAWAGGFETKDTMIFMDTSRETMHALRGKDIASRPQQTIDDKTWQRMLMSSGGIDVMKPEGVFIYRNVVVT